MIKRFLLIALLLAAALAAAGGDEIKWSSKEINPFTFEQGPGDVKGNFDKVAGRCNISWAPALSGQELDHITVRYESWELYCAYLNNAVKLKLQEPGEIAALAETAKPYYEDSRCFTVVICAREPEYANLKSQKWEVYFDVRGNKTKPDALGAPGEVKFNYPIKSFELSSSPPGYKTAVFWIILKKSNIGDNDEPLKLVMKSDKFIRGFEWRFKQK